MATMTVEPGLRPSRLGHLREMGLPIVFGAAVLLVSATLLLFANVTALQGSLTVIDHAQKVLNGLAKLDNAILSQEMTVRGLALTQDVRFMRYEKQERARVDEAREELLGLASTGPADRFLRYRQVMQDVAVNRDIFAHLAESAVSTPQRVSQAILDPAVRKSMHRPRAGIAQLRTQELQDLADGQHRMTDQITRAFSVAAGIILAAFVLGGIGIWATRLQSPGR